MIIFVILVPVRETERFLFVCFLAVYVKLKARSSFCEHCAMCIIFGDAYKHLLIIYHKHVQIKMYNVYCICMFSSVFIYLILVLVIQNKCFMTTENDVYYDVYSLIIGAKNGK